MYNENYYKNGKMFQLKPYAEAIHTFKTGDGTIIAIFQGSRGDNPELDFRVKYLNNDPNADLFSCLMLTGLLICS
ncbi:glutamine ABC transporter periplasmic protein [Phocaeicola salanitronis DSM 18170]|uniref:Glutamine ABC transporter periplasmic protein n=1 Tax=Phocaeicola salanitronis (strain DSM 18170 / JCM 13657 / CCUG 60908 / BL78) TaxID=667015 RepID=F0R3I7_PHOSB|nr:hypothetical protein [Phocaeicola salanitronis]ADY36619.1 glutamine ABC transporter periplasmic protein [Phocaeicola salanitronis DSM 18170]